jgi:hypothetical protein
MVNKLEYSGSSWLSDLYQNIIHISCRLFDSMMRSSPCSWVHRSVFILSAIVLLRDVRRSCAVVVIGGVGVVPGLWVILRLPHIPQIVRGRPR